MRVSIGQRCDRPCRTGSMLVLAVLVLAIFAGTAAIAQDRPGADALRERLASGGAKAVLGDALDLAARDPRDFTALLLLAECLTELGHAGAASRTLRRALAGTPAFLAEPSDWKALYGGRLPAIRERLAAQAAKDSRDALFLLGVLDLWSGRAEEGRARLLLADLICSGDALALTLAGESAVRPELRARESAERGRYPAALAEMAYAQAQAPNPARRGALAALLLSTGNFRAGEAEIAALLAHEDPLARFDAVMPSSQAPWWYPAGVAKALLAEKGEAREPPPSAAMAIGLAVLGVFEEARRVTAKLEQGGALPAAQIIELEAWIARCELEGAAPDHERVRDLFGPPPSAERAAAMLRAGNADEAARVLVMLSESRDPPPGLAPLRAALFLFKADDGAASSEVIAWLSVLSQNDNAPLAPRLSEVLSAQAMAQVRTRLETRVLRDAADVDARIVLATIAVQENAPDAAEQVAILAALLPGAPAVKALEARIAPAAPPDGGRKPATEQGQPATELFKLGDAAFAAGNFDLAQRRYLEAAQKDEALPALTAALLRGCFATGDYDAAARHLARFLDEFPVRDADAAKVFSSGARAAYRVDRDFLKHLANLDTYCAQHPVAEGPWMLKGVLMFEARAWEDAVAALRAWQKIAPKPRTDVVQLLKYAEARLR